MKCIICDNGNNKKLFESAVATTYRCKECRVIFSLPKILPEELYDKSYYENHYGTIKDEQIEKSFQFMAYIKKHKRNGSIFDYGCGTCTFLKVATEGGFINNVGADISDAALEFAEKYVNLGENKLINLKRNSLKDINEDRLFDVISFIDSIAHIKDIKKVFLDVTSNNLKEDGIVFIKTPNINYSYILYVRALSLLLPEKYIDSLYFTPQRYVLFNRYAMQVFLTKLGFEIVDIYFEKDYHRKFDTSSFKKSIRSLIFKVIPRIWNKYNAMILIAKRKKSSDSKSSQLLSV